MPPAPYTVAVKYLIKKLGGFPPNFQQAGAGWRAQRVGGGLPQEVSDLWPRGGSLPSPPLSSRLLGPSPPLPFLPLSPFPHPLQFSCPFNRPPSPSPYLAGAPGPGVGAPEALALLLLGS